MSSHVCLGGLPGPLVPGFLGELVTNCRKKGGRRREGRGGNGSSKDGAAILYSQVFLHVYKMGSPFPSLVWQLFFSLGMSTHPRYHLTPPGHCPVESCSWGTRDIPEYTGMYWVY